SKSEHRMLYRLFLDLNRKNDTGWDIVIFRDELKKRQQLEAVGGVDYLSKLAHTVPSSANCGYYAGIVLDKYKRRQLCDFSNSVKIAAHGPDDIETILQNTDKDLGAITEEDSKSNAITLLEEALDGLTFHDATDYLSSGFQSLDKIINGLGKGHVIVVAGRPSMGKTSFMLNIASHISKENPVGFFSLEMTDTDLIQRLVCSHAGVSIRAAMQPRWLTEDQQNRLDDAKKQLKSHKLRIDQTQPLTPALLRSRVYLMQKMYGVRVIFIDYLQLMQAESRNLSLYETVTEISKAINLSLCNSSFQLL
ncbi:unnamed protein product, partial [marine sediment metagenome]